MALDRFIYWNEEKPTLADVKLLLADFISGGGEVQADNGDKEDWFNVLLPGKPQWPFKSILPSLSMSDPTSWPEERWFEVCCISIDSNIDVITRQADAYTNALAACFAKLVARYYKARYEDPCETIDYGVKE